MMGLKKKWRECMIIECDKCGEHVLECGCYLTAPATVNIKSEEVKNSIVFSPQTGEWIMKLTADGILFNRETYPDAKPDDFAQAVIEILERAFTVKFERKQPPYDRVDIY